MRKIISLILAVGCFAQANNLLAHSLKIHTRTVYLGSTKVKLVQYSKGKGKQFVHVHESENTAKRAALTYVKCHGGRLLTLVHNGDRNITFVLRHQRYAFDPNRIFTKAGIRATLRLQSHYSPAAVIEVEKLAKAILRSIKPGKVIAVHNNKEYSIAEYFKGHSLSKEARAVHYRRKNTYRNFYLVTRYATYRRLKRLGFNVVWQARRAGNDGSLSVRLAKRDYVNVEAAYGAFSKQLRMLRFA
jgi:hypothetical protein